MELLLGLAALAILLLFVYPWLQERRDAALAKRLQEIKDPTLANLQIDAMMRQNRHEAEFFRNIARHIFPFLFR